MSLAALTPDAVLGRTLLALAVVVVLTRLLEPVLRRLRQPAVLAQVLAGVLLGPTVLGGLAPDATAWLLPDPVRSALAVVGGLGLVLFLLLLGLDADLPALRAGGRRLAAVTVASLALPFALGVLVALTVLADRVPPGIPPAGFALFVGTALSVSALPVLARLLDERDLARSRVGRLVLASASLQDAAAWVLLAISLAVAASGTDELLRALAGAAGLALALALVVRPVLRGALGRRLAEEDHPDAAALATLVAGVLACASLTQLTGLHAALGALAFGVAVPAEVRRAVRARLEDVLGPLVRGVLLPVYFLVPGLSFSLAGLDAGSVGTIAVLLAAAAGGKVLGAGLAARATGEGPRGATAIGVLLNTRGLVELIVLGVGLGAGVIDGGLYTELAIVALVTTFATGPLLALVVTDEALRADRLERPRRLRRAPPAAPAPRA